MPLASLSGNVTRTVFVLPSARSTEPLLTRSFLGDSTRREPSEGLTASVKVSVTCCGAVLSTAVSAGSDPVRAAWAEAGPAPPRRNASTAPSSARAVSGFLARRGAVCMEQPPGQWCVGVGGGAGRWPSCNYVVGLGPMPCSCWMFPPILVRNFSSISGFFALTIQRVPTRYLPP